MNFQGQLDLPHQNIDVYIQMINISLNKDLYQGHRQQKSCTSKSLSAVELASVGRGGASAQSDKDKY